MAATKLQLNWTGVEFTPTATPTPTPTPITMVTNVAFNQNGQLIGFSGDASITNTVLATASVNPTCSITSGDVGTVQGFSTGQSGALTATQNDAKGATSGSIVWAMAGATFATADSQGQHGQFASVTGHWQCVSTDGVTNPLTFTRA